MSEWKLQKIGDLSEYVTVGFVGTMAHLFVVNGVPLLRGQNILPYKLEMENVKYISNTTHQKWKKSALQCGDVVIVRVGYPGTACVIPDGVGDINAASLVIVRTNKDLLDPDFLCFILNSPWGKSKVRGQLVGAAQQVFNTKFASDLEIFAPDIYTQHEVSNLIKTYNVLIENNEKRIKTLEQMAALLYTEWFVKFKFPGHKNVKLVDSDTSYGKIPEGWEVKKLYEIAKFTMGQSPESKYYNTEGTGLPFHQGVADFGGLIPTDRVYTTQGNKHANAGDILFSVRAPVGEINIATKKIIIGRGVGAFRHNDGYQWYLLRLLKAKFTERDMIGNGAIYKAVNKNEVENLNFIVPPRVLVNEFDSIAGNIYSQILNLFEKNENLTKTRDLLIPQLVTGKRELKNI